MDWDILSLKISKRDENKMHPKDIFNLIYNRMEAEVYDMKYFHLRKKFKCKIGLSLRPWKMLLITQMLTKARIRNINSISIQMR